MKDGPTSGQPGWYVVNGVNTWWTGNGWAPETGRPTSKEGGPRIWVAYLVGLCLAPAGAILATVQASKAKQLGLSTVRYWIAFSIMTALTLVAVSASWRRYPQARARRMRLLRQDQPRLTRSASRW